jgi:hypothetical protein
MKTGYIAILEPIKYFEFIPMALTSSLSNESAFSFGIDNELIEETIFEQTQLQE